MPTTDLSRAITRGRDAIAAWRSAADGPSHDDEHEAGREVVDVLAELLDLLDS